MSRMGGRAFTWLFYMPTMVSSVLFAIVGLVTFGDLSQLNGALAATFMGPVLTVPLVLMSFFILVKKTVSRSGADFSYGFCTGYFLMHSMFLLLTGVELTANKHHTPQFELSNYWSSSATSAYVATFVLAFISAGLELVMGVAMISNRRLFGGAQITVDELGLSDRLRTTSPSSSAVAGSPAPPYTDAQPTTLPGIRSAPAGGAWSVS